MQSKTQISRKQYVEAIGPFMEALGVDAKELLIEGFVHTGEGVTGLTSVKPDDAPDDAWVSVGDDPDSAMKAWPFTIEVEW